MTETIIICGQRNSGKTSWVCALIESLSKEGLKVGTVKHTHHPYDMAGKDTDRHQKAGADRVLLVSEEGSALYRPWSSEPRLDEIVERYFKDYDLVLAEGYRTLENQKIIVGEDPNANTKVVLRRVPRAIEGKIEDSELQALTEQIIKLVQG